MDDDDLRQRIRKSINEASESVRARDEEKKRHDETQLAKQIEALQEVLEAFQLIGEELRESHGIPSKCHLDEERRFVEIFIDARDPNEPDATEPVLFFLVSTEANGLNPPMLFLGDGSFGGSHRVAGHKELFAEVTRRIGSFIARLPDDMARSESNGEGNAEVDRNTQDVDNYSLKDFLLTLLVVYGSLWLLDVFF